MSVLKTITVLMGVVFFAFANLASASSEPKYAHTGPTIITNVSVIDGLGNAPVTGQDIVLVDGKIAAIGATGSVKMPNGALRIDGTGMTAMPGLMDLHIHTQGGWVDDTIRHALLRCKVQPWPRCSRQNPSFCCATLSE